MFQGLGDRLSKSPWESSILSADAIFSNTLGEGNERSLIGKALPGSGGRYSVRI